MERVGIGPDRPKKRKRQRRQRGQAKQKAKMSYRKRKGVLKQKAKIRYRQVRKSPAFKRKKRIYRKFRTRHRRLGTTEEIMMHPAVEFMMTLDGERVVAGHITGVVADTWQVEYALEDGTIGSMDIDDFLDQAAFFDDGDIELLFLILDEASSVEDDGDEDMTVFEFEPPAEPSAERVVLAYQERHAFNKESPPDLLAQLVKVLDKASTQAEGDGRKGLRDAVGRVKGIAKIVDSAWTHRRE